MEDQLNTDSSIKTFTSALIFNGAVGLGIFVAFGIVRHWNKKVYQPRTYLVNEDVRSDDLPEGYFSWITASFSVPDHVLVERIGLDAYMFLRFMRMSAMLFAGFTLATFPILLPLNMVGEGAFAMVKNNSTGLFEKKYKEGLNRMNIVTTIVMLWKEMQEYTRRRQAYLMSEKHAKTPQSTTILVTAIPDGLNEEDTLYDIFNRFPGGVRAIWLNRDPKKLTELCKERDDVALKLENAEYRYIRSAYGPKSKKNDGLQEPTRPIGRTSMVPFVGPKVDLIDFYSKRLSELNREIGHLQEFDPTPLNSAFIQFHTQFGAHSAVQTVVHPTPFKMAPMYVEISPLDVVWDNMNLNPTTKKIRSFISVSAATALAIFWSIPVIAVSSIANLNTLMRVFKFLEKLPPGHVQQSSITISLMKKYFVFLVVNVLMLSTIAGGALNTFKAFEEEGFQLKSFVGLIGGKLPDAATFFITYTMLQGCTGPVMELLQIAPLVLNILFTKLLAKSPRQIWNVQGRLSSINYGIYFPIQTLTFSIGMVYSTVAPVILPFVAFFFTLYYWVFRHQFLYVYQQPVETGGLAFPVAVRQAFTGIFISEITVLGIFLLKSSAAMVPHLIILVILILATIMALNNLNEGFNPLITFLPVALFSKDLEMDKDGNVVNKGHGNSKIKVDAAHDEEAALANEKGSAVALTNLSSARQRQDGHLHPDKASLAVSKHEYDESADVSSQMPAVPTPNPSEYDAVSLARNSLHPSSLHAPVDRPPSVRNRPVSYARSIHPDDDAASRAAHDEDPELRRLQEQAYCHPDVYRHQTPIWLPMDERGFAAQEIQKLANMGIIVATDGAGMDPTTAKTQVTGILFAPGEEDKYRLERGM
ncbi:hypothetical protein BGX34_008792 [Mortierella sp. NVP85]|nr:hypothetical protein BGX34_008792 [Mortierella sp. NVP85]